MTEHVLSQITLANVSAANNKRKEASLDDPAEPGPEIRVTRDGTYYFLRKGTWYETEVSYLGSPIIDDIINGTPDDLDPSPPAKWEKGYKSQIVGGQKGAF